MWGFTARSRVRRALLRRYTTEEGAQRREARHSKLEDMFQQEGCALPDAPTV